MRHCSLIALWIAPLIASCGGPIHVINSEMRDRWQKQGVHDYRFITRTTMDPDFGVFEVLVRADTIAVARDVINGRTLEDREIAAWGLRTIDHLFEWIDSLDRNELDNIRISYDHLLGYPDAVSFEYDLGPDVVATDNAFAMSIDSLVVLSTKNGPAHNK
jgi:hypothetical protein